MCTEGYIAAYVLTLSPYQSRPGPPVWQDRMQLHLRPREGWPDYVRAPAPC